MTWPHLTRPTRGGLEANVGPPEETHPECAALGGGKWAEGATRFAPAFDPPTPAVLVPGRAATSGAAVEIADMGLEVIELAA